jgi:hypothetical protein
MTMGVLGTLLLYAPLLASLAVLFRGRCRSHGHDRWLRFGVAAWLVAVLVSSVTLVTLFSVSGLTLTAALLGIGLRSELGGHS